MPRFLNWFQQQSKTNRSEVSDDISQLETTNDLSSPPEEPTTQRVDVSNSLVSNQKGLRIDDIFMDEITIHIAQYVGLKDLNNFAQVDSYSLKLLFNREKNKIEETFSDSNNKDESNEFHRVQQLIWKPLVHFYFPKFEKDLNIKNWMHVMRRRMKHVKLNTKIQKPSFVKSEKDEQFIENCEWIYKCPLNYNALTISHGFDNRHCNVCNKDVYLVNDMKMFKQHTKMGDCVAYTIFPSSASPILMMGSIQAPTTPPLHLIQKLTPSA